MSITVTDILSILRDFIDVLLVWFVIYYILKNIRNNIKNIWLRIRSPTYIIFFWYMEQTILFRM